MYADVRRGGYAVVGFAAYNLETLRALVETADILRASVIIQTTPSNSQNCCGKIWCIGSATSE